MEHSNNSAKPYNMEANIAAALSYLVAPLTGIIFFLIEKENRFVRFHAFQSILFGVAWFVAFFIASSLTVLLIGFILMPIVSIGGLILWLILMYKAYNNEEYELPYLGKIAKDQVNK
jgi:uncharacterized membrane protein